MSNEGTIKRLNSEILSLQQDGKSLESERTLLQSTQFNTNEQIEALRKVSSLTQRKRWRGRERDDGYYCTVFIAILVGAG